MKRKFLEDMGLTKEQVDNILDENSQDIGKAKGDLDTANQEITSLREQIVDRDSQLETLKNSTGDVEALREQIATLQADNKTKDETHAAEIKQLKIDSAVLTALTGAKAKNNTAVKALLKDLDKAEFAEDGTIKGLAEQIEVLKPHIENIEELVESDDVQAVLDAIDDVIVDNILANNDEPDDEGIKLQKIYDEIFNENL